MGWDQLRWVTINAMKSAFLPFDERLAIIDGVIKPDTPPLSPPGEPGSQTSAYPLIRRIHS